MNIPYVKNFKGQMVDGTLIPVLQNPIKKSYLNREINRKEGRRLKQGTRPFSNRKATQRTGKKRYQFIIPAK